LPRANGRDVRGNATEYLSLNGQRSDNTVAAHTTIRRLCRVLIVWCDDYIDLHIYTLDYIHILLGELVSVKLLEILDALLPLLFARLTLDVSSAYTSKISGRPRRTSRTSSGVLSSPFFFRGRLPSEPFLRREACPLAPRSIRRPRAGRSRR